jgi:hypothetical protein
MNMAVWFERNQIKQKYSMSRKFDIQLERAAEQLRQERKTFEQRRLHEARWFRLRLVMGYTSVGLLIGVMVTAIFILVGYENFPSSIVVSAGVALFTDVLGVMLGLWKIALTPQFNSKGPAITIRETRIKKLGNGEVEC